LSVASWIAPPGLVTPCRLVVTIDTGKGMLPVVYPEACKGTPGTYAEPYTDLWGDGGTWRWVGDAGTVGEGGSGRAAASLRPGPLADSDIGGEERANANQQGTEWSVTEPEPEPEPRSVTKASSGTAAALLVTINHDHVFTVTFAVLSKSLNSLCVISSDSMYVQST
jgi:hypothetical protein